MAMNCPRCKSPMQVRGDEFVCEKCGLILAPPKDDAAPTVLPGANPPQAKPDKEWIQPARPAQPVQADPPPANPYYQRTEFLDPISIDLHPKKKSRSAGLGMEKNLWFSVNVIHAAVAIFLPYLYASEMTGMGMVGAEEYLFYRAIFFVLSLVAVWFVLYEREVGWKWSCAGLMILGWLAIGYEYFTGQQLSTTLNDAFPALEGVTGMLSGLLLIRLIWDLWFLSILWRDIKEVNASGV